jgi:hypothetical protein
MPERGELLEALRQAAQGQDRRPWYSSAGWIVFVDVSRLYVGTGGHRSFGSLKRVHHPHKKTDGWFLGRNTTIYKKPYTVALEVDAESEKLLNKKREVIQSPRAPTARAGYSGLRIPVRLPPRPTLTRTEPDFGS